MLEKKKITKYIKCLKKNKLKNRKIINTKKVKSFLFILRSHQKKLLDLYVNCFMAAALKQKCMFVKNISFKIAELPTKFNSITLIKSPHVFKKSKEHFYLKTYTSVISINKKLNSLLLKSLFVNIPTGINLTIKYLI